MYEAYRLAYLLYLGKATPGFSAITAATRSALCISNVLQSFITFFMNNRLLKPNGGLAMENLLTPVSTSYKTPSSDSHIILVRQPDRATPVAWQSEKAGSPEEALEILRNEPDYETLVSTLHYLVAGNSKFSITQPSPLAAQLVHVLVSETVPTYWNILRTSSTTRKARREKIAREPSDSDNLLFCLRSVTGLNAILLNLKQSINKSREPKKVIGGSNIQDKLTCYLEVLSRILEGDKTIATIATSVWSNSGNLAKQKAIWHEFLGLVGAGKILGISAEAEDIINELAKRICEKTWISSGSLYSTWLAQNVIHWAQILPEGDQQGWRLCAELLSRSFRLGHTGGGLHSEA